MVPPFPCCPVRRQCLWKKILIEKKNENVVFEKKWTANVFNIFFINIGPNVANDIPMATRSFKIYFQNTNETVKNEPVTKLQIPNFSGDKFSHRDSQNEKLITHYEKKNRNHAKCFLFSENHVSLRIYLIEL